MNHRADIYVELELKHKCLSQTSIDKRAQEKSCNKLQQDPSYHKIFINQISALSHLVSSHLTRIPLTQIIYFSIIY